MGFFRKLFGKPDALAASVPVPASVPTSVASNSAPRTGRAISYDATLVESLLRDHAELGRIFAHLGEAQQAGKFDDISSLLIQFKTRLESHLLTENVRFYNYLDQTLGGDSNNAGVMHDFRREMNGIARRIVDFVRTYQACTFTPDQRRAFAADYEAVGKLLEQRLDNEESSLYPLYQPD